MMSARVRSPFFDRPGDAICDSRTAGWLDHLVAQGVGA